MMEFSAINFRTIDGRKKKVRAVYQDAHILVLDKPSGIPVIPDRWNEKLPNLYTLLMEQIRRDSGGNPAGIWIVHRIDTETSGLVLFAKSGEMHQYFNQAFMNGEIRKTYMAIVTGIPEPATGRIDFPLSYSSSGKVKVDPDGKPSLTEYAVIEKFKNYSLLAVYPTTGRTHQIRVHLKAIGHPLAIDSKYSGNAQIQISQLKKVRFPSNEVESCLMSRLTLHAWKLEFLHPGLHTSLQFESELPKDFQALCKALRKWNAF